MQHHLVDENLKDYYARRAHEYERVYDKPERQADLASLRESIPSLLDGRNVLEIACGTGFWTQFVATRAASVLATGVNEEVLEHARRKSYSRDNVVFELLDIYAEQDLPRRFDAGLAAFWWSHVPRQSLGRFFDHYHRWLQPDALVVFLDNRYVQGSSTPLSRSDEHGNTYQTRTLDDDQLRGTQEHPRRVGAGERAGKQCAGAGVCGAGLLLVPELPGGRDLEGQISNLSLGLRYTLPCQQRSKSLRRNVSHWLICSRAMNSSGLWAWSMLPGPHTTAGMPPS